MDQNGSSMVPESTQVRAMLGSKAVMDPPKSEAKTMSKKCLQKVDFLSHLGGILGPEQAKKTPKNAVAALTRGRGGLQICKNWQELARDLHVIHHSCTPQGGGAGSTCPAGQPRHRALG